MRIMLDFPTPETHLTVFTLPSLLVGWSSAGLVPSTPRTSPEPQDPAVAHTDTVAWRGMPEHCAEKPSGRWRNSVDLQRRQCSQDHQTSLWLLRDRTSSLLTATPSCFAMLLGEPPTFFIYFLDILLTNTEASNSFRLSVALIGQFNSLLSTCPVHTGRRARIFYYTSMEEQPKDRAQDRRYHHHGEERHPIQYKTSLKNDQLYFQYQHQQETQTKKTGNGKINTSDVEGEKILSANDLVGIPHPTNSNGNRHLINANVKQKSTRNVFTTFSKVGSKEGVVHKKNMDCINDKDKALDFTNHYEGKFLDKKESALFLNGVVNSAHITNGYSSKSPPDNDGSGSEGGYTTPKKRKARRNSIKNTEHVTREKGRAMQQGNATQEPEVSGLEPTEKMVTSQLVHKADAQTAVRRIDAPEVAMGELQKKNSDIKTAAGAFGKRFENRPKAKLSSSSKEDSWTLFKPPPVFPVDNSSAKIVPKISYASKVKENLNKAAQAGGEVQPPQVPGRLSQVPMSAMKTIISASFTNGPVSGDGNSCPSVGTFFTPAASSIPPAPSLPCGENVASTLDNDCNSLTNPAAAAVDLRKCTLFIYPLNPLNMQPVLPSARQVDTQAAQTNQNALGDIFQNQWGLSFINEPNVGPEGGSGPVATVEGKDVVVTFQGEQCPAAKPGLDCNLSIPEPLPLTLAQDSEKRTCALACPPATVKDEDGEKAQLSRQDKTKGEAKSPGAVLLASCKDISAEPVQAPLTNLVLGLSKEQAHSKSLDSGSWGSFDLKAAVTYHTKEMEYVFNLQKQDPKRVVCYDKTKDGPDQ